MDGKLSQNIYNKCLEGDLRIFIIWFEQES